MREQCTVASTRVIVVASGVITAVVFVLSLFIGELAIRAIHLMRDGIPFYESPAGRIGPIMLDQELGWRATADYEEALTQQTKGGITYAVHRSQHNFGFRQFGNLRADKPKLLVIGDSFTQATAVSDDKTYYALLGSQLDMEVFAYGAGGYGTLQEYMILDRYVDEIKPDLILWQFCVNDFINNDNALERASTINNNGMIRPYWEKGAIAYLSPKPTEQQLREWINHYSRFLYFLVSRVDRLRAVTSHHSVETFIEAQGFNHEGFSHAVQVTDDLMKRVRARTGNIPIVAFSCVDAHPYSDAFVMISRHYGIEYWNDVGAAVRQAADHGADVETPDGHWNEAGHRLIATRLAGHLQGSRFVMTGRSSRHVDMNQATPSRTASR